MKFLTVLIAVLSAVLVMGCSSITVTTDYDHEANFAALKTFTWLSGTKDAVSANAPTSLFQNQLVDKRFRTAVKSQLEAKGLTENAASPDFYVVYYSATEKKVNVTNYGYGYGPRWGAYGGGVDVQQYTQGTVIIDLVDAKTKELLWRSVGSGALASNPDPSTMEEKINGVVQQMLESYPPKPGSK